MALLRRRLQLEPQLVVASPGQQTQEPEVSVIGSLAVASFSLRLPLAGRVKKWRTTADRNQRDPLHGSARLLKILRDSFADEEPSPEPCDGFDLLSVGQPLTTASPRPTGAVDPGVRPTVDLARALRSTSDSSPTIGFETPNLTLPDLFADLSTQAFERSSWDPVLLGGRVRTRGADPINPNDTIVVRRTGETSCERELLQFLAVVWDQRRSYLFAPSMATRIHNVFLPVARLGFTPPSTSTPAHCLIVVPVVSLMASPVNHSFRRVVTVSLIVLPARSVRSDAPRLQTDPLEGWRISAIPERDMIDIAAQWDWSPARARKQAAVYEVSGTLVHYLDAGRTTAAQLASCQTLHSFAESLVLSVGLWICNGRSAPMARRGAPARKRQAGRAQVEREVLESLHIAKTSVLLPWTKESALRDPLQDADDLAASLTNLLFSTVRQPRRDSILAGFRLPEPPIPEGAFISAYYVAPHSTLVHAYTIAGTPSQQRGPVWMLAYLSYLGIALSTIRASLLALHREVDQVTGAHGHLLRTAEALVELEEVFDLQFAVKTHRAYYEEIRSRDGAMADYDQLVREVNQLRDEATLRRGHRQSQHLLVATALIAALTGPLAISSIVGLIVAANATSTRIAWGWVAFAISLAATLSAFGVIVVGNRHAALRWFATAWSQLRVIFRKRDDTA